ncbi:MAG: hypothetical protein ACI8TF_002666 [Paracoccaceae bacterium]|jgi:hypothetical protein
MLKFEYRRDIGRSHTFLHQSALQNTADLTPLQFELRHARRLTRMCCSAIQEFGSDRQGIGI